MFIVKPAGQTYSNNKVDLIYQFDLCQDMN